MSWVTNVPCSLTRSWPYEVAAAKMLAASAPMYLSLITVAKALVARVKVHRPRELKRPLGLAYVPVMYSVAPSRSKARSPSCSEYVMELVPVMVGRAATMELEAILPVAAENWMARMLLAASV